MKSLKQRVLGDSYLGEEDLDAEIGNRKFCFCLRIDGPVNVAISPVDGNMCLHLSISNSEMCQLIDRIIDLARRGDVVDQSLDAAA